MPCGRALNFDQLKTLSENTLMSQGEFHYGLLTNLGTIH